MILTMKKPHNAPKRVWLYWCKNCGAPITADLCKSVVTDCPYCPHPLGEDIGINRYELIQKKNVK